MTRQLLKQALAALEGCYGHTTSGGVNRCRAILAIRDGLEKPEQTPVAWLFPLETQVGQRLQISYIPKVNPDAFPVYRAPVNCKYPTCHSADYQQALAADVADQIFGSVPRCRTHPDAPRGFIAQPGIDGVVRFPVTDWSAA